MFRRISRALAAGRQAATLATAAATPNAGPNPVSWALVHFGDARDLVPRLAAHRAFCLRRGVQCLLVADDIPQLCVTSREVRFEFVPWPSRAALSIPGGHAAAADHSFRRLGRVFDFWQVVGCDWHGDRAQDLLQLAPGWAHPAILAAQSRAQSRAWSRARSGARSGAGNASQEGELMLPSSGR